MNKAQEYILNAKSDGTLLRYAKYGVFKGEQVKAGLTVETKINGVVETTNTSKEGDWLLTGSEGEQYLIDKNKFADRYEPSNKPGYYNAVGICYAVQYKGPSFTFKAPWGEDMICNNRDYIATTSLSNLQDVYRIEAMAFKKTYKKA